MDVRLGIVRATAGNMTSDGRSLLRSGLEKGKNVASRNISKSGFASATLLVAAAASLPVSADEIASNPSLTRNWVFDAGAVIQNLDGDIGATTSAGAGGSYDLSRLGLDSQNTSPFLALHWRFADRWRFDFNYDSVDTDGHRGNSTTLDFGRISIPKGYRLDSSLETRTYWGAVGYSFVKTPDTEFGARLGLNVLDSDASLKGSVRLGGKQVTVGSESVGSTGLIPTLGLYGIYAFNNHFAIEASVDGLAGSLGDYKGHYVAADVFLKYWINNTFAVGLGYRYLDSKLEHQGDLLSETIELGYSGPVVKASIGF